MTAFSVPIRATARRKPSFHDDWGCDSEWMSAWDRAQVHAPLYMPKRGPTVTAISSVLKSVWTSDRMMEQMYARSPLLYAAPAPPARPNIFRRVLNRIGR